MMSPRWDFRCPNCGRVYPDLQFSNWKDATKAEIRCETCHFMLQKQTPASNFVLRGFGFHRNDYPKDAKDLGSD